MSFILETSSHISLMKLFELRYVIIVRAIASSVLSAWESQLVTDACNELNLQHMTGEGYIRG